MAGALVVCVDVVWTVVMGAVVWTVVCAVVVGAVVWAVLEEWRSQQMLSSFQLQPEEQVGVEVVGC